MLSDAMMQAMNNQINAEMYSSYLYLSMSACFEEMNFSGMAAWMQVQAKEEMEHAMKFYKHIIDRMGRVTLKAIDAPPTEWKSPLAIFQEAYKHEQKVTGMINGLMQKACDEKDHASVIFLQWFVTEQVEEEAAACGIVEKLKMIGDSSNALIMYDRALGMRASS